MTNPLITARDAFLVDTPETRLVINGRDWGMIRVGDNGPALVLIPGTLGRADVFWQQITALSGKARILALSYPATGGIEDWAKDIAGMIKDQGLEGAMVLGSSLGGYLAQYVTAKYPELVGGLVAANTLVSAQGIDQKPPYKFDVLNMPIAELRAGFEAGLKGWLDPANPYSDLAGLLLAEVAGRIPEPELRARIQALKTAPGLLAQSLPKKVRYTIESDDDHLITPEMRQAVRDVVDPGRSFRFRAASHFPYVAQPKDYTALLEEVLGLAAADSRWPAGQEAIL